MFPGTAENSRGLSDTKWHPEYNNGILKQHPVKMPFSATYGTYCDGTQPVLYPAPHQIWQKSGYYDYFRSALPQYISRVPASGRVHRAARPDIRSVLIWIVMFYSRFYMEQWGEYGAEDRWDEFAGYCETELDAMDTDYIEIHVTPIPSGAYGGYNSTELIIPATREAPDWMTVEYGESWRDTGTYWELMSTEDQRNYIRDVEIQRILGNITCKKPIDMVYVMGDIISTMGSCARHGYWQAEKHIELALSGNQFDSDMDPDKNGAGAAAAEDNWLMGLMFVLRMFRYLHYNVEPPNPTW